MSEIHPEVVIGDQEKTAGVALPEAKESDRLEHETETLMLATFLMLPFKESATPKVAFKPVSNEEKRKGAALYARRLLLENELRKERRKSNTEAIRLIISFQEQRPQNPCSKQAAFDYLTRRILLDRVR